MSSARTTEVIIVGGGPAGACAANLLAAAGRDVTVLEREHFPRFHIGESLLPAQLPILERLGVDLDDGPFLRKRGALFIDERSGRRAEFSFAEGMSGTPPFAHQVERSVFDQHLLQVAAERGATVLEGHAVVDVALGDEQVEVEVEVRDGEGRAGDRGRMSARFLVDATGQNALLGRRRKTIEPIRGLGRAAAFRRFDGLRPEIVRELHEHGDVIIKIVDDGWMWGIPLACGGFSVGVVKATGKVEHATLDRELERSPELTRLLEGATPSHARVIGNFAYRNTAAQGRRFACIGDAACFLDPVFSSGVLLALKSGERLADLLGPALAEGREDDPELMVPLREHMDRGYDTFHRFIHRFYHTHLIDNMLLAKLTPGQAFRAGVISVLAGDVWRDDNQFQNMLARARRVG